MDLNRGELYLKTLEIINVLLHGDFWKIINGNYVAKLYIDKYEMVVYGEPIKIFHLPITDRKIFMNEFSKIINNLGFSISYSKREDLYTLMISKSMQKECAIKFESLTRNICNDNYDEKINEFIDAIINNYLWVDLNNGISYLEYEVKTIDNKVIFIIDKDIFDFDLDVQEYKKFEKELKIKLQSYKIITYGNEKLRRYFSSDDLYRTKKLYNSDKIKLEKKK